MNDSGLRNVLGEMTVGHLRLFYRLRWSPLVGPGLFSYHVDQLHMWSPMDLWDVFAIDTLCRSTAFQYFSSLGSSLVFCSERPSPRNSPWHDPELFPPSACWSACPCAALVAFMTLLSIPKVLANQFHSQRKGVTPSILWHFHLRNILSPFLSQLWADQLVT